MKIISINVNGIRAAARKGLFDWLHKVDADIICLQELKAQSEQIEDALYFPEGYHRYIHCAEKKGYSGVGIYCKKKPINVHFGLGAISNNNWDDVDSEGRYIQVDFETFSVASIYMPSGSSKEIRQAFKYDMMDRMEPILRDMQQQSLNKQREFILCGDWNIAHKKIDIKNWRGNQKNSGFLPEERAWLDWLFNDTDNKRNEPLEFVDAFRAINSQEHQYTWWSNRGQAWENNTGWRIDYHIVSAGLKNKIIEGSEWTTLTFSDSLIKQHFHRTVQVFDNLMFDEDVADYKIFQCI